MESLSLARLGLFAAALGGFACEPAWAAKREVALTYPDELVNRMVLVKKIDGKTIRDIVVVRGFDKDTKTFQFESAREGDLAVPASEIAELSFSQSLRSSSPQAQQCPWRASAENLAVGTIKVKADKLTIGSGRLTLDDENPKFEVPRGATVEVLRITYDSTTEVFQLTLRSSKYLKEMLNCGSGPSAQKGLQ